MKNEEDELIEYTDTVSTYIPLWIRIYKYISLSKRFIRIWYSFTLIKSIVYYLKIRYRKEHKLLGIFMQYALITRSRGYYSTTWRKYICFECKYIGSEKKYLIHALVHELDNYYNCAQNIRTKLKNLYPNLSQKVITSKIKYMLQMKVIIPNITDRQLIKLVEEIYKKNNYLVNYKKYYKDIHYNYIKNNSLAIYYSMNGIKTVWGPWN